MVLNDHVVFNDLAVSSRGLRSGMVSGMGRFGKPEYLPPEVLVNLPFHEKGRDLWDAVVILFNLPTGEIVWTNSISKNLLFHYFVLANSLSRTPANKCMVGIQMDEPDDSPVKKITVKLLSINPHALDLLEGILKADDDG
jgi:hypothetical protein